MYMCYLVNLAEDKSYAAQERSRFRPEYIFLPDKNRVMSNKSRFTTDAGVRREAKKSFISLKF